MILFRYFVYMKNVIIKKIVNTCSHDETGVNYVHVTSWRLVSVQVWIDCRIEYFRIDTLEFTNILLVWVLERRIVPCFAIWSLYIYIWSGNQFLFLKDGYLSVKKINVMLGIECICWNFWNITEHVIFFYFDLPHIF